MLSLATEKHTNIHMHIDVYLGVCGCVRLCAFSLCTFCSGFQPLLCMVAPAVIIHQHYDFLCVLPIVHHIHTLNNNIFEFKMSVSVSLFLVDAVVVVVVFLIARLFNFISLQQHKQQLHVVFFLKKRREKHYFYFIMVLFGCIVLARVLNMF